MALYLVPVQHANYSVNRKRFFVNLTSIKPIFVVSQLNYVMARMIALRCSGGILCSG